MSRARAVIVFFVLSALAASLSGCASYWIGKGFPLPGDQAFDIEAPNAPALEVRIEYDAHFIPHIEARSEPDAMFGLGYAAASARLLQLDMMRHLAAGEMSKLLGPKTTVARMDRTADIDVLEVDFFLKTMDFVDTGKRLLAKASPESRAALEAYATGINAFVDGNKSKLSAPYSVPGMLGGKKFAPWTVEDSASVMALASWLLAKNFEDEYFAVLALQEKIPVAKIVDLLSPYYPLKASNYLYLAPLAQKMQGQHFEPGYAMTRELLSGKLNAGPPAGSNNWVVSGKKTKSGKPMLANDPHLPRSMPDFWFLAQLKCPSFNVVGAFLPGIPVLAVGHNGRVAWGNTMVRADQADTAVETIDADTKMYKRGGQWLPMAGRKIQVGDEKHGFERTLYATEFGPILTKIDPRVETAVSMRWTGWFPSRSIDAGFAMMRAKTAADFRKAAEDQSIMSLNLVYADAAGIHWTVTGDIPVRQGYTGLLPKDGANEKQGWTGMLTQKARPGGSNPDSGFYATANNRPDSPHADAVAFDYSAPYRFEQISKLLEGKKDLTLDDMRRIQSDTASRQADAVLPYVLSIAETDPDVRQAIDALSRWDRRVAADSHEALYWEVFLAHFTLAIVKDFPPQVRDAYLDLVPFRQMPIDALYRKDTALWQTADERDVLIKSALKSAVRELRTRFGDKLKTATWGDLHKLYLQHPLSTATILGDRYRLPVMPYGGDNNTVNPGASNVALTYDVEYVSSLRFLVDMARPEQARFSYPGGQSEIPSHPSYSDLLPTWYHVEDNALPYAEEDWKNAPSPTSVVLKLVKRK